MHANKQSLQIAHQNITALAHLVNALVERLNQSTISGVASGPGGGSPPTNPIPVTLSHMMGNAVSAVALFCSVGWFLSNALIFFSPTLLRYRIIIYNYIIVFLRGQALALAQASMSASGDKLCTLRQGARSVADYAVEFRTLAEESG